MRPTRLKCLRGLGPNWRGQTTSGFEIALGAQVYFSAIIGGEASQVPFEKPNCPFIPERLETRRISRVIEPDVLILGPGTGSSHDLFSVGKCQRTGYGSHRQGKQILD